MCIWEKRMKRKKRHRTERDGKGEMVGTAIEKKEWSFVLNREKSSDRAIELPTSIDVKWKLARFMCQLIGVFRWL